MIPGPEAVLKTVDTVDDSYAEWVKDLFGTLTMMIPLLQPETVFWLCRLHPKRCKRKVRAAQGAPLPKLEAVGDSR